MCHVVLSFTPALGVHQFTRFHLTSATKCEIPPPRLVKIRPSEGRVNFEETSLLHSSSVRFIKLSGMGLTLCVLSMCLRRGEALLSAPKMTGFT